jgi:hypothetical protein
MAIDVAQAAEQNFGVSTKSLNPFSATRQEASAARKSRGKKRKGGRRRDNETGLFYTTRQETSMKLKGLS